MFNLTQNRRYKGMNVHMPGVIVSIQLASHIDRGNVITWGCNALKNANNASAIDDTIPVRAHASVGSHKLLCVVFPEFSSTAPPIFCGLGELEERGEGCPQI